jgi:hypothetical protein
MSKCDQNYLIVDYFFNELKREDRQQFESHLTGCKTCEQQLGALAETSRVLKQQKREEPEKELLHNYHRQLRDKFNVEQKLTSRIGEILEKFVRRPSIAIRVAEAVVLILIGIFIGKTVIWQQGTSPVAEQLLGLASQPLVEDLILKNYLQQTEMIFLDVANLDPVEDQRLISNLVQSAKYKYLLQKTLLLREQAKELDNNQLADVLSQIELILLELCNMETNAYEETLFLIKQQLKDTHLLIEMKTLNQMDI